MSRRLRTQKHPEYIQLQPYRALVGGPIAGRRNGALPAFLVGAVKGILWAGGVAALALVGLAYLRYGADQIAVGVGEHAVVAGLCVAVVALLSGTVRAARR